jgi:hypothetical protein
LFLRVFPVDVKDRLEGISERMGKENKANIQTSEEFGEK